MVEHLSALPQPLITFLIATLPVSELRGAIPWALTAGGLGWQQAYFYAVLGNFLPVIPLLLLLEPVSLRLRKYSIWDKFFTWLFERTRRRSRLVERYEALGLALFVAIPLPVTGAWTGTVAAFLFGIRFKFAVWAILAGILIAGVVVTLASLGVLGAVSSFLVGK
ncbi:MAG TPA: ligand-binding protein SH3 [Firmicutes bacterium]|nr:MAG: ligand-binding protein SH3 [Candidatus Latescibacterota bacterium]HDN67650.1 ligand-binding protein SH3 [Bacillota bacterium]